MFKTVLFPITRTPESRQAADVVLELVKQFASRLFILSVVEATEAEATSQAIEATAQLLAEAKSLFDTAGIAAETLEREGKPAFVICDVADELEASLIVMGCRGMGFTGEGLEDSVTAKVINLSPCPVLIVP